MLRSRGLAPPLEWLAAQIRKDYAIEVDVDVDPLTNAVGPPRMFASFCFERLTKLLHAVNTHRAGHCT